MRKKKGEVPKTTRNRTPEQEVLLRDVRAYQAQMKMRMSTNLQILAMERNGFITPDKREEMQTAIIKQMEGGENVLIREAARKIKGIPIWEDWLKHVYGIADTLGVQFIALIQPISDFPNVAKLWTYAGQSVEDGEAVRRRAGKKFNWNPQLKTLCYQAAECFVKCGGPYRELYDRYKARDKAVHPEIEETDKVDRFGEKIRKYTPAHMHMRAMRYSAKIFLSHLWQAWRELEGLPVRGPYAVEYLGHTTILSPWTFITKPSDNGKTKKARKRELVEA